MASFSFRETSPVKSAMFLCKCFKNGFSIILWQINIFPQDGFSSHWKLTVWIYLDENLAGRWIEWNCRHFNLSWHLVILLWGYENWSMPTPSLSHFKLRNSSRESRLHRRLLPRTCWRVLDRSWTADLTYAVSQVVSIWKTFEIVHNIHMIHMNFSFRLWWIDSHFVQYEVFLQSFAKTM